MDLEIFKGEFLTMLGPSGSGKTTCLMMLAGFESSTHGESRLGGKPIGNIPPHKRGIGMVFQNYALFPHMSVGENLAFPLEVRKIGKSLREEKIKRVLEIVKMTDFINRRPTQLSGGQQQRVGIARSLAVEPDIWFLDEPFSALDPLIRKEMQDEFLRLQSVLKKTILFVTHDFDEALRLADRIAIMKDGIIEQLDTPANIVLNPATEYVRKFTEDVPREKVLKIESVMDAFDSSEELSDLKVSKDAIIETVAEEVLGQEKPVAVMDSNNKVVGAVHSSKVIHVLFGSRAEKENKE
jgi:glycine betaine/proline transport system ATP-binding protein